MKELLVILATILGAMIAGPIAKGLTRSVMTRHPSPVSVTSAEHLARVASEMNKSLPMMVGQHTQLVTTAGADHLLIYQYRLIDVAADELAANYADSRKPLIINAACTTPDTRDHFLKEGVRLRYSYVDSAGVYIASFDVTASDCGF